MRRYFALVLLAGALLLLACSDSEKQDDAEVPPDPANASYLIENGTVQLSNGKADQEAAPGSASHIVTTLTDSKASGDLDGDGHQDVAVVLTQSRGGSGTFYYAAVVSSGVTPAKAVLLGDRIAISKVSITSGVVTIDYLTRPDGAPFTTPPSVPASRSFKYASGVLTPN